MRSERNRRMANDLERDMRWVARIRAGDESAFAEIYASFFPRVYAFVLKRVGNPAEAEDLTQETFVQLYRSLGSYEGRSSLLTWTFGIAHNVCSRWFRHCSRWMVGPKDARELEDDPFDAAIEDRLDATRVLERCDEALETSRRPAHREIFRLRYAERQSIRSIAKRVGKSSEAVKVSLRRSRNVLAEAVPELETVLGEVAQGA
ncbi:MAG: RNA polymerase sigma factor [Myxococcota bacterium]